MQEFFDSYVSFERFTDLMPCAKPDAFGRKRVSKVMGCFYKIQLGQFAFLAMIRLRTNVRQSDLSNVVALAMICRYQVHHDHCYVRQLDGAILVFCVAQFKLDPMVQSKVHFQGSNYVSVTL